MAETKNIQRTQEYMMLNRSIASCENMPQLETLRESVMNYHRDKKDASGELLANFIEKENDLSPESLTIYARLKVAFPSFLRLQNKVLTCVHNFSGKCSIEVDSEYEGDLSSEQYAPSTKSEFDAEMKKAYNKISINL